MKKRLLIGAPALLVAVAAAAAAVWLYWTRPQRREMALYAPAETLVYFETENLPETVSALAKTDAWRALAPAAGLRDRLGEVGWLSRVPYYTGLGGAEAVVFSRAQACVAVLGFDTSELAEGFRVRPRVAIVLATRASAERTKQVSEKYAGDFARRALGARQLETIERDGATLSRWAAAGGRSAVFAVAEGDLAVIGNDEAAVLACLRTARGERANLAGEAKLAAMRARMDAGRAAAFGYASPAGLTLLVESIARAYIERAATDERAQGLAASLLPQLSRKIIGTEGAGWSARFERGQISDRYFVSLQPGLTGPLREVAKIPHAEDGDGAREWLPGDAWQITRYLYRDPALAWRGLNNAVVARLDALSAVIVTELLKESLRPYGVRSPNDFLRHAGPGVTVARLRDGDGGGDGGGTITAVSARDAAGAAALRALIEKQFGSRARRVTDGGGSSNGAQIIASRDPDGGAAAFTGDYWLLGPEDALRRCLAAHASGETLANAQRFAAAAKKAEGAEEAADAVTYTDERDAAFAAVGALIEQPEARRAWAARRASLPALNSLPYAVTTTRLSEEGVERTTRSAFGQFGWLAAQLADGGEE